MQGQRYAKAADGHLAYRELWRRIDALPGVEAAGAISALPLSQMFAWGPITVEGRTRAPGEAFINADMRFVDGEYFRAMRIPLVEGRLFVDGDRRPGPLVALVDARMAAQLWPGRSPIGRRAAAGRSATTRTRRGSPSSASSARVKQYTLDGDSRIAMYLPHAQFPVRAMNVVIRSGDRSGGADRGRAPGAARRGSRAADVPRPHDGGARRRIAGAPALPDGAARAVRGRGAGPGRDRHLRRPRLPRLAGRGGSWRSGWRSAPPPATSCGSWPDTAWPSPRLASPPASPARCSRPACSTRVLFEVSATDPLTFAGVALALAVIALLASIAPALARRADRSGRRARRRLVRATLQR